MEKFHNEIVDLIVDTFKDDRTLVKNMLKYLYDTTTDDSMMASITNFFNAENICITCGSDMIYYPYREYHSEIEAYEDTGSYICPLCDRDTIEGDLYARS